MTKKKLVENLYSLLGKTLLNPDLSICKISAITVTEDGYRDVLVNRWSWRKFRIVKKLENKFVFGEIEIQFKNISNINSVLCNSKIISKLKNLEIEWLNINQAYIRFEALIGDLKTFKIIVVE